MMVRVQTEMQQERQKPFVAEKPSVEASGSVGLRVQEERVRLGLTQTELAERLGISRTSATLYEAGKHLPRAEVLIELDTLGADVLYILTGRRATNPTVDLELLAFALGEAKQQCMTADGPSRDQAVVEKAWSIYLALHKFKMIRD